VELDVDVRSVALDPALRQCISPTHHLRAPAKKTSARRSWAHGSSHALLLNHERTLLAR
jgi:hypothetical protein